jgi:hypothetical protein
VPDSARPTRDEEASVSGALGSLGLMPYLTAHSNTLKQQGNFFEFFLELMLIHAYSSKKGGWI